MKLVYGRNIVLVVLVLIAGVATASAQWIKTNGPYGGGGTVWSLAMNGSALFAGTQANGVFRSTDGGASWNPVDSGLVGIDTSIVTAIEAAGSRIYISTNSLGLFVSSDGGSSWEPTDSGITNRHVMSLTVSSGAGGALSPDLLAGTTTGIFFSTDSGSDWDKPASGFPDVPVYAVAIAGAYWYAGTFGDGVFVSGDSGATWHAASDSLGNLFVRSLAADGNDIFAGTADEYSHGGLFISTDHGSTWRTALPDYLIGTLYVNGSEIFAGSYGSGVFHSSDTGRTWSRLDSGLANNSIAALAVVGRSWYAGTYTDGVFVSSDTGAAWSPTAGSPQWNSVSAIITDEGELIVGTSNGLSISSDDGATWNQSVGVPAYERVTAILAFGDSLYAGTWEGEIFQSTDGGEQWTSMDSGLGRTSVLSLARTGGNLIAGTETGMYAWSYSSRRWNPILNTPNNPVEALAVNDSGVYAAVFPDGVLISKDGGLIWKTMQDGLGRDQMETVAVHGNYIFAGTAQGVFVSSDGGATWMPADSGFGELPNHDVSSFAFSGGYTFAAVGESMFVSSDNGKTWRNIDTGLYGAYAYDLVVSNGYLFAGTGSGVWRRPLSEMITSVNDELPGRPQSFVLDQNYPNPFNPETVIEYRLPKRSYVRLTIYDVLGREVDVLASETQNAGDHSVIFNAATVPSGVYFYRLEADGHFATKKLVLLK